MHNMITATTGIGMGVIIKEVTKIGAVKIEGSVSKKAVLFPAAITAALALIALFSFNANADDCEKGHRVKQVIDDGNIVILEDNSIWEINNIDNSSTAHWLPGAKVIVCEDKLINTNTGESAKAEEEEQVEKDAKKEKVREEEEGQNRFIFH